MLLWGEVDIALTTAVRHGEIEGKEAQSLAVRVDRLFIYKALIKAHSLPHVRTKIKLSRTLTVRRGVPFFSWFNAVFPPNGAPLSNRGEQHNAYQLLSTVAGHRIDFDPHKSPTPLDV